MKTIAIPALLIIITLFSKQTNAQYEKKLTLQVSAGYVSALSPSWFQKYYPDGSSGNIGVQYNFSRKFSIAILANSSFFWGVNQTVQEDDSYIETNSNYLQLGMGIAPKFRFLTNGRLNPFVLGGLSANYLKYEYYSEERSWDGDEWDVDIDYDDEQTPALGLVFGAGFDYRITDDFSLFTITGVKSVWNPDSDYRDLLNSFYVQLGFNINLFKSKSL
jgi:hypothetical protein